MKNIFQETKLWLYVVSLLCFSCYACALERETYSPLFMCSKKLNNPYGICTHINRSGNRWEYDTRARDLEMIDSIGATWIRTDFDWTPYLQKDMKGAFSYRHHDEMMLSINASKKEMFGLLVPPRNKAQYDDWNIYIANVVNRYKDQVKYWEVINEADIRYKNPVWSWFKATDYVELLKSGSQTIKKQNKKAIVLFSGMAYAEKDFLDSVLSQNVSQFFDIMTVHHYTDKIREPEEFLSYYAMLSEKLERHQIAKPLWLTETSCFNTIGKKNDTIAAKRLPRIFLISFVCGVEKVFWYKSRARELDPNDGEDFYGLWHKDYIPKPAFYTYQTLTKMCPNKSTRPILSREGNVYMASWKRPDRKKAWALWTSKTDEVIALDIKGGYKIYNERGEGISDRNLSEMRITPSVIYIIGAKDVSLR